MYNKNTTFLKGKNIKKRILIIFAIIVLCVAAVASVFFLSNKKSEPAVTTTQPTAAAEPANPLYSEGLEYYFYEKENIYHVAGIGICKDEHIRIPPEHNGLPVTRIKYLAFTTCDFIKKITVPGSVSYIESNAFLNCTSLETVILPRVLLILSHALLRDVFP